MSRERHNKRLHREAVKTGNIRSRDYFVTNGVVDDWNALTQETIDSKNKNLFKNRIDKTLKF